jgi:hypothetical protein
MLSSLYSVKLLSPLLWTEAFRNTGNCGKPWSTLKGHSFLQRFSGVQKSTNFLMELNTQSLRLKAVPQSDFKTWILILKISEFQIEQEKAQTNTHTHTQTKCWYTVCYLVRKFLNFLYWITMLNRAEVTEHQDTVVHSINSYNPNERFSFKNS